MKVTIPQNSTDITKKIYEIMNSSGNSVQQQYDKTIKIKTEYNNLIRKGANPLDTQTDFIVALDNYAEDHKKEWSFFNYNINLFLDGIDMTKTLKEKIENLYLDIEGLSQEAGFFYNPQEGDDFERAEKASSEYEQKANEFTHLVNIAGKHNAEVDEVYIDFNKRLVSGGTEENNAQKKEPVIYTIREGKIISINEKDLRSIETSFKYQIDAAKHMVLTGNSHNLTDNEKKELKETLELEIMTEQEGMSLMGKMPDDLAKQWLKEIKMLQNILDKIDNSSKTQEQTLMEALKPMGTEKRKQCDKDLYQGIYYAIKSSEYSKYERAEQIKILQDSASVSRSEAIDDALINLTGYSLDTLVKKSDEEADWITDTIIEAMETDDEPQWKKGHRLWRDTVSDSSSYSYEIISRLIGDKGVLAEIIAKNKEEREHAFFTMIDNQSGKMRHVQSGTYADGKFTGIVEYINKEGKFEGAFVYNNYCIPDISEKGTKITEYKQEKIFRELVGNRYAQRCLADIETYVDPNDFTLLYEEYMAEAGKIKDIGENRIHAVGTPTPVLDHTDQAPIKTETLEEFYLCIDQGREISRSWAMGEVFSDLPSHEICTDIQKDERTPDWETFMRICAQDGNWQDLQNAGFQITEEYENHTIEQVKAKLLEKATEHMILENSLSQESTPSPSASR